MQVNTIKAFIEANTTAICADTPPAGRHRHSRSRDCSCGFCGWLTEGSAFCGSCGKKNDGSAFCVGCGAAAGGAPVPAVAGVVVSGSAGGFVEVPQHAQAQQQQAARNMMAQSQTAAVMRSNQALASSCSNHQNY
jgi:hypothetical protein